MGTETEKFSRQFRLLNKREYKSVFGKADKTSDRNFTILWRPNGEASARLGLAISKKYLHRAVDRNRVKRLIRESFRKHRDSLPQVDIVVLAGRSIRNADNTSLSNSLDHHWDSIQANSSK